MEFSNHIKEFVYPFGKVYCYENYVIGNINESIKKVDTAIAKKILEDIHNYYSGKKIVYISNRSFSHDIDPSVYKLVNPKKLIGIAIVGKGQKQRDQASSEQPLYSGSFGFFENMDSAISWAQSFLRSAAR